MEIHKTVVDGVLNSLDASWQGPAPLAAWRWCCAIFTVGVLDCFVMNFLWTLVKCGAYVMLALFLVRQPAFHEIVDPLYAALEKVLVQRPIDSINAFPNSDRKVNFARQSSNTVSDIVSDTVSVPPSLDSKDLKDSKDL